MALTQMKTLLNVVDVTATGTSSTLTLPTTARLWVAYLSVAAITGTSPTLDITLQHSADGANWVTLIAMTQLTGASGNSVEQKFAASATDYLKPLLPYLRASYTIGGTSTPTFNDVTLRLYHD